MTEEHKASRTIVKSPPELWAECSVAQSLARHLGEFGEIRITRLEPETTVAWEGEHASGTVRLEPSGWGTQVTLTARPIVAAVPEPEVIAEAEVVPEASVVPEAEVAAEAEVAPEPEAVEAEPGLEWHEPEDIEVVEAPEQVAEPEEVAGPYEVDNTRPRWPVFARLWARLGRKSHDRELEQDDGDSPGEIEPEPAEHFEQARDPAEPVKAVDPVPEPVDAVPERVEVVPQPVEVVPEPVEAVPERVAEAPEPGGETPETTVEASEPAPQLDHQALLVGALDSLGQAHHRPFSRG